MPVSKQERQILRQLAERLAQIAQSPAQLETARLWKKLNAREMERPMVLIDQVPWHEIAAEELAPVCSDPLWKGIERGMRRKLYQYEHFAADMVIDPWIALPKAVHSTGFGIVINEEIAVFDTRNDIVGHKYNNQFLTMDDVEKIKDPVVTHDTQETARRKDEGEQIFSGILPVRMAGVNVSLNHWDVLSMWMSPEAILYGIADNPALIHAIMRRYTDAHAIYLDQLDAMGLFSACTTYTHCSRTGGDNPPIPLENDDDVRIKDVWACGMAQIFSTVSPRTHVEYEFDYVNPVYERFGAVYYGCCEPLHDRIEDVMKVPNLRKISCSPWTDIEIAAEHIGNRFIASRKPAPSFAAADSVDWIGVERELSDTVSACAKNGTPLEFILKDISTVCYQPHRLTEWSEHAMEAVCR